MSFTHKVGVTFSTDAGTITSTVDSYSVDSEVNLDESVPSASTNKEYDVSLKAADIKTLCIYCDHDATIKTNSTGAPVDTLNLLAKKQVIWTVDHLEACPITADVTKLYVTMAAGVAAALKIRVGLAVGV